MSDAIVIGGGPNGLVAANLLVDQGWEVVLVEANDEVGGAVRSDSDVADGFIHDTFSSFYPLAAASPTIQALELHKWGLEWSDAPAPFGNPMTDGGWAIVHDDPLRTAAELDAEAPGDGDSWLALYEDWRKIQRGMVGLLLDPFPPIRSGSSLALHLLGRQGLERIRLLASSVRSLGEQHFRGDAGRMLFATNAQHADITPESAGSGLMGWLLVMLGQQFGYPVPKGGAGRLAHALADRFRAQGGTIVCGQRVTGIEVSGGRATGVRTASGEYYGARRAVLADVSAPALYGELLPVAAVPRRVRRAMEKFEWDPGTVKVDWALDGPIPWQEKPSASPGTVHIARSVDALSMTAAQIAAGLVPTEPFLLMGQMTTADPTRSPAGTEAAWAYTHVPQRVRGDDEFTGRWDADEAERFADRMQAQVERAAPGFEQRIIRRRILAPPDLERRDANLVGGAVNGGTSALHQQLVFRPIPGLARAETPVKGLYLASASAHPGGGVHGACGSNAARAAILHAKLPWR
ncbi:FAD dependent oxidoreductase [Kribbella flavida DSM 17836]|uniref:Pyridine nucleotide-disulfide oxidoreductase domain-containing protein 2 n=1 Tax=Kribbella flavida (strain DSM 17836 / JCM 10339 / NBRC 14399) TaxID=479435 RepID=D2PPV2_KRIFD|nr:NAD(P)/FAD-dependent oxidoreductase [Kribbella flavida]ADB32876.1 FAD dependent oxidoreductase [Kribbella flavida DSM 17836]